MTKDELISDQDEIARMAAAGFTTSEIAVALGYDKKAFARLAAIEDSVIWCSINRGKMQSEFTIAEKQKELAEAGNITAVQIFEKMKAKKQLEELRNRIWFGT